MSVVALSLDRLSATVGLEAGDLIIVLSGAADFQVRPELAEWLRDVHEEALRLRLARVVVDLRKLEFMSSLCLNAFVGWLVTILDQPLERQYRVHFRYNRSVFWQRKSLTAMRRLAMRIVTTDP